MFPEEFYTFLKGFFAKFAGSPVLTPDETIMRHLSLYFSLFILTYFSDTLYHLCKFEILDQCFVDCSPLSLGDIKHLRDTVKDFRGP